MNVEDGGGGEPATLGKCDWPSAFQVSLPTIMLSVRSLYLCRKASLVRQEADRCG